MKNNDNARQINAAARTYITNLLNQYKDTPDPLGAAVFIATTIAAYHSAGMFSAEEFEGWTNAWTCAVRQGTIETVTCDDCGATIPTDLATVLGDGDLCLCARCKDRTCGPLTTADAERGSDGFGDFEDAPAFQRGMPVELD